ncbi:MAG: DUF1294 domain-containing protein [Candidatus Coproplasma sp.]
MLYLYILIGLIVVMGLAAFGAYGVDKSKAKRHNWRIPEATLLALSALGGCFGGILAMLLFRHKTKHWYFWAVNIIACIVYAAFLVFILFKFVF